VTHITASDKNVKANKKYAKWLRVCLVPHFTQKILGFGLSFCRMELNTMQNFWQKGIHSPFGILDGTKHTHENFGILHFIIPK
jgi:hypothetical protein